MSQKNDKKENKFKVTLSEEQVAHAILHMATREDIKTEIQIVRNEISNVRTELKGEIQDLRTELKGDIHRLEGKVDSHFKWLIALMIGMAGGMLSILFKLYS